MQPNRQPQLLRIALALTILGPLVMACQADTGESEDLEPWQKAEKTEVWEPVPPRVEAPAGGVPSDAVALFDGTNLDEHWEAEDGGEPAWAVEDGVATIARGEGGIRTKKDFCDIQLHIEWRSPADIEDMDGQNRGNSGVFFQERYEVQVLDSYDNETYPNGQAGSVYKQSIPLVNASRPPGVWQSYDIIYTAPRFDDEGELEKPAYVTVLHNGVLVQNHVEIQGPTRWIGEASYDEAHGCAPLFLQDHDSAVSYRNIWVREL